MASATRSDPEGKKTVRQRKLWIMVLVPISAIVILVLASIIWLNHAAQTEMVGRQAAGRNTMLAQTVNNAIFDALSTGENDRVRSQFARLDEQMQGARVFVYDFNGRVSFSTDKTAVGKEIESHVAGGAAASVRDLLQTGSATDSAGMIFTGEGVFQVNSLPIHNEQRCHHCHGRNRDLLGGITVISRTDALLQDLASSRKRNILVGAGGVLVLVACIYLLFHFLVNQPVQVILDLARCMRGGDFTRQVTTRRKDELAHIQNRLNLVNGELQTVFSGFLHDSNTMAESSSQLAAICRAVAHRAPIPPRPTRTPWRNPPGKPATACPPWPPPWRRPPPTSAW
jgi:methyl-accepting chemotaxis protein